MTTNVSSKVREQSEIIRYRRWEGISSYNKIILSNVNNSIGGVTQTHGHDAEECRRLPIVSFELTITTGDDYHTRWNGVEEKVRQDNENGHIET